MKKKMNICETPIPECELDTYEAVAYEEQFTFDDLKNVLTSNEIKMLRQHFIEGYSIKDCSLDATFVSYNSDVNVYSTSSANNSNNINGNSTSNNILNTQKESVSNTSINVKQSEYKWYVSNDNTQECVGKCVISNVTSDSFDVQVSHARSQGIGYYPKTAYLQKDGTYVADGDISGRNVKTNESEYTPVKFVFTVLDNDRIKMDVYETKTNKEMEKK